MSNFLCREVQIVGVVVIDRRQERAGDEGEADHTYGQADTHAGKQRVNDAEEPNCQPDRRHRPSSIGCKYRMNCFPTRREDHLAKGKFFMHNRKQWTARRRLPTSRSSPPWCAKAASRAPQTSWSFPPRR